MKRLLVLPVLLGAVLALAAVAGAGPTKQPHPQTVKTVIHTTDGGCAGTTWADDTITRTLKVHLKKDGSYRIREQDKGTFVTNAGGVVASPGNCPDNHSRHGHTVLLGKTGTLKGYITGTVTGGTFNPNGSCAVNPCTQALFIKAFFGLTASFSCQTNSTDCKFKFDYHAKKNEGLLFRHWQDRGHGAGTLLNEKFKGDIASA